MLYAGIFLLLLVGANAIFGENGFIETLKVQREYAALTHRLAAARAENARLRELIDRYKHDSTLLEEAARTQLGLIKPGEVVVVVKKPAGPSAPNGEAVERPPAK